MRIRHAIMLLLLAIVMAFGAPPQQAHAEDEWSDGIIGIAFGYVSPKSYRNYNQSLDWGQLPYLSSGCAELLDADGKIVGSMEKFSQYEFSGLKAGTYTLRLTLPNMHFYNIVTHFYNGSSFVEDAIKDISTEITINEGNPKIVKWVLLDNKSYEFSTSTEIGKFENGETTKTYYEGGNPVKYDANNVKWLYYNNGIYHGDNAGLYKGMNALEVPALSEKEKSDGYFFKGWALEGDDSGKVYTEAQALAYIVKGDTTFKAVWGYPTHKISFRSNLDCGDINGSGRYDYTMDFNNQKITDIPEVTAKDGYRFVGWYQDFTTNVIPEDEIRDTVVDQNLVYYAKFASEGNDNSGNNSGNNGSNYQPDGNGSGYGGDSVRRVTNSYTYNSYEYTYNTYNTSTYSSAVIGSSEKDLDKAVLGVYDDGDMKGSSFGRLKAKGMPKGKNLRIKWTKTKGASKYVLYGNMCNHGGKVYTYKKMKSFGGGTTQYLVKNIRGKKLKKGTYYKFKVAALDKDGKVIAVSKTVHVVTNGSKWGNDLSVKKVNPNKSSVSIKAGKSKSLKAKEVNKKKVHRHRGIAWESSNTKVATVKNGRIKAKAKGKCKIWAYAQNGFYTTYTITVK